MGCIRIEMPAGERKLVIISHQYEHNPTPLHFLRLQTKPENWSPYIYCAIFHHTYLKLQVRHRSLNTLPDQFPCRSDCAFTYATPTPYLRQGLYRTLGDFALLGPDNAQLPPIPQLRQLYLHIFP